MAPSLQELIDFLLNEVALCGSQGAYSSELRPTLLSTIYTLHLSRTRMLIL